jgi:hypothetical protein
MRGSERRCRHRTQAGGGVAYGNNDGDDDSMGKRNTMLWGMVPSVGGRCESDAVRLNGQQRAVGIGYDVTNGGQWRAVSVGSLWARHRVHCFANA